MPNLLVIVAVLPVVLALSSFGLWRNVLSRPWGFLIVAIVISYVLMATTIVYALQGIGIAGDPGKTAPAFGPVERRLALYFLIYMIIGFAALFGVTFLFRKG